MVYRQFQTVPAFCPHCGKPIGEQAFFQTFEQRVASWLGGQVAPVATPAYDVIGMEGFPKLTFQVKFSSAYTFHPKGKKFPQVAWAFHQKHIEEHYPDFFVLFGLSEENEYCFLLPRQEFIEYANRRPTGQYYLRVSAKPQSDRENYDYIPKIWRYEVKDPAANLKSAVLAILKGEKQFSKWSTFYDCCQSCGTTEIPHNAKGLCQRCYRTKLRIKHADKYNANRRAKYQTNKTAKA